ncbi:MAG TPA: hypothetical protein VFK86_02005 [Bauldia sp.]|nr:hypothetical protein [Bauldia sp.]
MQRQRLKGADAKAVAGARYTYGRRVRPKEDWNKAADETLRRFVADWCEFWRGCGYRPCFRTGRCRRPGVPCFTRDITDTTRILFKSKAFVELYDSAVDIVDGLDDEE